MPQTSEAPETPRWLTTKVAGLVWRITPNCREVARLTSEARDRALPLGARTRLGLHRAFCKWCARYAAQLDLLHEATHRLPEHLDKALPIDAKARMKQAMRERQG